VNELIIDEVYSGKNIGIRGKPIPRSSFLGQFGAANVSSFLSSSARSVTPYVSPPYR